MICVCINIFITKYMHQFLMQIIFNIFLFNYYFCHILLYNKLNIFM